MRYIGDIHGQGDLYAKATEDVSASVQVGDLGCGFIPEPLFRAEFQRGPNHRFIRGNHDDPAEARRWANFIDSGMGDDGVFYLGGGFSIDAAIRTPGLSWWPDEEHNYAELCYLAEEYLICKPRRVVSHECPVFVSQQFFNPLFPPGPSRTSQAMQVMLALHAPVEWIFGHWHKRRDHVINGTRFICLEEGGWIDLPEDRADNA